MTSTQQYGTTPSRPLAVPRTSSPASIGARSLGTSAPRTAATARLASPVPSYREPSSPNHSNGYLPTGHNGGPKSSGSLTPLAGVTPQASTPGPGISALAAALSNSLGQPSPRLGTPPLRQTEESNGGQHLQAPNYGSLASRTRPTVGENRAMSGSFDGGPRSIQGSSGWAGPVAAADADIVNRHLVQPSERLQGGAHGNSDDIFGGGGLSISYRDDSPALKSKQNVEAVAPGLDDQEFSSLRLQGGDTTRHIYKWTEDAKAKANGRGRIRRSKSFHLSKPEPEEDVLDIESIKVPGGFRRNYLKRAAGSPSPLRTDFSSDLGQAEQGKVGQPQMVTNNFIEFLTLYGHFAGEELEEDDEVLGPDEYFTSTYDYDEGSDGERESMEDSALLTPGVRLRRRKERQSVGNNTPMNAALLLLKSFVGTGVLFLPKAYLNGGMLFSNLVLLSVSCLSYYCFCLLVNTRLKVDGSYGDIGGILYGRWMRNLILSSIVISQVGFVAAYIVFTSENLQAFILAVSHCKTYINVKWLILMQMSIFLPFSLLRDISKLGITALIADAFILVGLGYLYYYDILTIVKNHGVADIINFNYQDWTLFIGTAIFTFEGIGLIIPIQESMKEPRKFPKVLGGVMIIISVVFISMGALSYAAYGSKTETVVILNLPQDDKMVNGVQFLYSVAILLSTPLQIFPAIRITENELFTRSGKYNPYIKWQKNVFRFFVVMLCAGIAWIGANDLDKFVSIVGSFACIPLVYIYPVSLHLLSFPYSTPCFSSLS